MFPRHTSLIIGGSADTGSFLAGTETLLSEEPVITPDGWDSLTRITTLRAATLTAEELAAIHPIGQQLGSRKFWLVSAKPIATGPGVWTIECAYKGFAVPKPCKVTWGSVAEQRSATLDHPAQTYYHKWWKATYNEELEAWFYNLQTDEIETEAFTTTRYWYVNLPTYTIAYLVESVPAFALGSGRDLVPAWTDPNTGATLSPPSADFGYILMDVNADLLPGTSVALVTQTYKAVEPPPET